MGVRRVFDSVQEGTQKTIATQLLYATLSQYIDQIYYIITSLHLFYLLHELMKPLQEKSIRFFVTC